MKWLSKTYVGVIMTFMYAPIAVLIVFSFNQSKSRGAWTGFTLDWYKKLFTNEMIISSLMNTLVIAVISSIIATILGTLAAIGIRNMKRWQRAAVMNITYLPIINPEIVTGVSLMLLFVSWQSILELINQRFHTAFGLEFGLITLIIAHITFNVPYVILNVMPKLRQMDVSVFEAAQDLGCSPVQAFFKVVIPEIMPGIIAGFLMAFTYSLDDFIISYFVSGATSQTLPITIFSMTRRKVSPEINALSTIIFVVVLTVLLLVNLNDARKERENRMKARARA